MKVRILGCGTSTGVPKIGNEWGECDPNEPRNRRLRTSILFESGDKRVLVDCGPDLRQQLLAADVNRLNGVILTHTHGDHCHGLDELRPVSQAIGGPLPLHAREGDIEEMKQRFAYAFDQSTFYRPIVEARQIGGTLQVGNAAVTFVEQPHGGRTSLGMRFDEDGRSIIYSVDYSEMTQEMAALYEGADVWISDCLTRRPHPTHAHLDGVLRHAQELAVGHVYLVHMGNSLDYRSLLAELPDWATPAHDGLDITC